MYKEYREMSRTEAVDALYQDMAARHRSRFRSIHVCHSIRRRLPCSILTQLSRSSKLSSSRRPTMSSAHTSSNSSLQSSRSLSLTVSPKLPPKLSLQLTGLRPLHDHQAVCKWGFLQASECSNMLEITGPDLQIRLGSSSMKSYSCLIELYMHMTLQASDIVFEKVTFAPPISDIPKCATCPIHAAGKR